MKGGFAECTVKRRGREERVGPSRTSFICSSTLHSVTHKNLNLRSPRRNEATPLSLSEVCVSLLCAECPGESRAREGMLRRTTRHLVIDLRRVNVCKLCCRLSACRSSPCAHHRHAVCHHAAGVPAPPSHGPEALCLELYQQSDAIQSACAPRSHQVVMWLPLPSSHPHLSSRLSTAGFPSSHPPHQKKSPRLRPLPPYAHQ